MIIDNWQTFSIVAAFLLLTVPGGWLLAQGTIASTSLRRNLARVGVIGCVVSFAVILHVIFG